MQPSILTKFPVCFRCNLSEEQAKCDIEERTQCGLILCRKCRECYGNEICNNEGCKKPYKKHNFRKNFNDKYRKELNIRFDNQFRVRCQWQQYILSEQMDPDLVHIMAAVSNQNRETYDSMVKKEVKRLIDEKRSKRVTIESNLQGRSLPVFIKTVENKVTDENTQYDGRQACGYNLLDYSKGFQQIANCFAHYY